MNPEPEKKVCPKCNGEKFIPRPTGVYLYGREIIAYVECDKCYATGEVEA